MSSLASRPWLPNFSDEFIRSLAARYSKYESAALESEVGALVRQNRRIHDLECVNLNPATNVMNPRAEEMLSSGLGARPSLGYPGDKYEMGLEAIERIEVIAAQLASEVFDARYVELRVPSGSIANLYAFLAICKPGDKIIVPPPSIGGHVTHHQPGAAGLLGLDIHFAPVDADNYTVDIDGLRKLAREIHPRLITIGGSLNLFPHPILDIRSVADEVESHVLFDAAHLSGMIAGKGWQQPLKEGAHLMTMSTYKSLGGPPSGMIVTNDASLAERLDHIAFPGLTANFDVAKTAALAVTLLDWKEFGCDYADKMARVARAMTDALLTEGLPVHAAAKGGTTSHQFALEAEQFGGGQSASKTLRRANILASGIGLPLTPIENDLNGLRLGTTEIVRRGMTEEHMPLLAKWIARTLSDAGNAEQVAGEVTAFRQGFQDIHFIRK